MLCKKIESVIKLCALGLIRFCIKRLEIIEELTLNIFLVDALADMQAKLLDARDFLLKAVNKP